MKIRMQSGSVRLRLTRSEVARFAASGRVDETVAFPSARFHYALIQSASPEVAADCSGNSVTVRVPERAAKTWSSTEQVGIEAEAAGLKILIEKDFQCAHGLPDPDAFVPRPETP